MNHWYQEFRKIVEPMFGSDFSLFCDILAATSPRRHIKTNWRYANEIYNSYKNKEQPDLSKLMKSHRRNVIRALQRKPLSGRKITNFSSNLKGDLSKVTIDTWILKHFGFKRITNKTYSIIEEHIKFQARKLNIWPAELQAKIWCETIIAHGKKPASYISCIDKQTYLWR